jgi:ribosomal protein L21E
MAKYLGINSQHRDYIKVSNKLDYLVEDAAKIIKSNLLKDGKYTMWKTFKVKSYKGDMYAESYLSLTKYIAYEHPNFEKDFEEFNKQYPYSTKDDFIKEFIGRLTIPILGYKLCDYTKLGFMMPGAVAGARNNQFEKGGSIGNKMEHGGMIGDSGTITDSKSMYQGKMGFIEMDMGNELIVKVLDNGKEKSVTVRKSGFKVMHDDEMSNGGNILSAEEQADFDAWFEDGNVEEVEKGVYATQDYQWNNRIKGKEAIKKFFAKEY